MDLSLPGWLQTDVQTEGPGGGGWGRGAAPILPQVVSAEPSGAACLDGGVRARSVIRGAGGALAVFQHWSVCVRTCEAQARWQTQGQRPQVWAPCPSLGTDRALLGLSRARWGERGLKCLSVWWWGGSWGQAWRFSVKNRAASLPSSPSASTRSAARLTGHGQGVAPERCCAPENGVSDKNNPG